MAGQGISERESASDGFCASCYRSLTSSNLSEAATVLRVLNLLNGALVIFAGIWSLFSLKNLLSLFTLHFSYLATSLYVLLFGCLLCLFELRFSSFTITLKQNFGFMFTYVGRTAFLFFLGLFCLGLYSKDSGGEAKISAGVIIGVLTFINAVLNCLVLYWHRDAIHGQEVGQNYETAENRAKRFAAENPDVMWRAAQSVNTVQTSLNRA